MAVQFQSQFHYRAAMAQRWIPTSLELVSSIYIDFEGTTGRHPTLLGVRCFDWTVRPFLVDPAMWWLADVDHEQIDTPVVATELVLALSYVKALAEAFDSPVVAFSEFDLNKIRECCPDPSLVEWFEGNYRNGKRALDYWLNRTRQDVPTGEKPHTLDDWMDFAGITRDAAFGSGLTGDTIRSIRRLKSHEQSDVELLPSKALQRWSDLLGHNETDLIVLQMLMLGIIGLDIDELEWPLEPSWWAEVFA